MKQLSVFGQDMREKQSPDAPSLCAYWKLSVDGASRNNPGPSGAGIYLVKNDQVFESAGYFLGVKTNNQAEYLALLIGLVHVRAHMRPCDKLLIISDSQLLIRQLGGEYKVRHENIKHLHRTARTLLSGIAYSLMHVLREDNAHADHLANVGIDTKNTVSSVIMDELTRCGVMF